MKLCDKIYTCRTRAKLSQEELAEKVGVSRQAVSRWECGDNVPEPAKLLMLARLFGVTADWLLDDDCEIPEAAPEGETKKPWVDTLVENCKSLANRFDRLIDESIPDGQAGTAEDKTSAETAEPAIEDVRTEEEPKKPRRRSPAEIFKRLIGRFGWPLGLYVAAAGVLLAALASLARQIIIALGVLMMIGGLGLSGILLFKKINR